MPNRDDVWIFLRDFFVSQLQDYWDDVTIGGQTFDQKYGITRETCREFSVGFAPHAVNIFDFLQRELKLTSEDFINNDGFGFIRLPRRNVFDGRIIFAYMHDAKPIYFSGRATDSTPDFSADKKYLHMRLDAAKLTEVPLYLQPTERGLNVVIEGHTHALRLRQEGFHACGIGGGRPNEGQIRILKNRDGVWLPDVDVLAPSPGGIFDFGNGRKEFRSPKSRHEKIAGILDIVRRLITWRIGFYPDEFCHKHKKGDATDWFLNHPDPKDFVEQILLKASHLDDLEVAAIDPAAEGAVQSRQIEELLRRIAWRNPIETSQVLDKLKSHLKLPGEAITHAKKQIKQLRTEGIEPPQEAADFTAGYDFREFEPGQDYKDGILYYCVSRKLPVTTYRKNEPVQSVVTKDFMIGSDGSFFPLDESELCKRRFCLRDGFQMAKHPSYWTLPPTEQYSLASYLQNPEANIPDGPALLREMRDYFRRFVYLEHDEFYTFITLFAFISYCLQIFDTFGILALHGTRETGKSRLMEVLESICFNPNKSSSQTSAYIVRVVDSLKGTMFMDEQENLSSLLKTNEQVGEKGLILKDCYRKGGAVGRCLGDNNTPYTYTTYCTYVVANTRGIEPTLQSRTFYFPMVRYRRGSNIIQWRRILTETTSQRIRAKLYCWTLSHATQIADFHRRCLDGDLAQFCDDANIRGRELEIWTPPITLAALLDDLAGQPWKYNPEAGQVVPLAGTFLDDIMATQSKITAVKKRIMASEDPVPVLLAALRQVMKERLANGDGDEQLYPVVQLTETLNRFEGLKFFPRRRGQNGLRELFPRLKLVNQDDEFPRLRINGEQRVCVKLSLARLNRVCDDYDLPLDTFVELAPSSEGDTQTQIET